MHRICFQCNEGSLFIVYLFTYTNNFNSLLKRICGYLFSIQIEHDICNKKKNQLLNDEFVKLNTIFENKIYHVIIDILISKIKQ